MDGWNRRWKGKAAHGETEAGHSPSAGTEEGWSLTPWCLPLLTEGGGWEEGPLLLPLHGPAGVHHAETQVGLAPPQLHEPVSTTRPGDTPGVSLPAGLALGGCGCGCSSAIPPHNLPGTRQPA